MKKILSNIFSTKYIEIILAVGLFIILDTGVLILNFYTSYQIANEAHAIQVANRQTILSQNLFHQLYQVRDDAAAGDQKYLKSIDALAETYKTFDETMDAFNYGGELIGTGQGSDKLLMDEAYRKANEKNLKEADELWKQYRIPVKHVVYAFFSDLSRDDVVAESNEAIKFARANNQKFNELLNDVAYSMEDVARKKAEQLRIIQTVGISLAVLNFFLILFHFLRKLRQSDALIEKARRETTDILANVNEGLLLLDKEYTIGSQYSASLGEIFRQENFAGRHFFDLLKPLVTEKTLRIARDYVDILFSKVVSETLVTNLNPLDEVQISLANESGSFTVRYLSFNFSRVVENDELVFLLVTVSDITDAIELQQQLKDAEIKAAQDIDMLLQVIHLDGGLLLNYLSNVQVALASVNNLLKQPVKTQPQFMEKVLKIARIIHTLKGECASLDLSFIEKKLHDYETTIEPLKTNNRLTGSDFIPLAVRLNQLMSDVNTVVMLVKKINGDASRSAVVTDIDRSNTSKKPVTDGFHSLSTLEVWKPQFEHLVAQVAKDHNKAVKLILEGAVLSRVNPALRDAIRDITIQCLRNAVVHGLELPSQRSASGKSLTGNIRISVEQEEGAIQVKIRDDGKGIDIEAIRAKAIEKGMYTAAQLESWQPNQLIKLIFQPGFSTFNARDAVTDKHAGRGVGLDVVKNILDEQGGKMSISYRAGEFTEFRFRFDQIAVRPLAIIA